MNRHQDPVPCLLVRISLAWMQMDADTVGQSQPSYNFSLFTIININLSSSLFARDIKAGKFVKEQLGTYSIGDRISNYSQRGA